MPLEIYRLVDGAYQLQIGEPFWMPEIGLGIGRGNNVSGTIQREVLYWFDRQGTRYLTGEEQAKQAQQELDRLQQELDRYRQQFGSLE